MSERNYSQEIAYDKERSQGKQRTNKQRRQGKQTKETGQTKETQRAKKGQRIGTDTAVLGGQKRDSTRKDVNTYRTQREMGQQGNTRDAWHKRFVDCVSESSDGICCLDFHKFHQMESCAQSVLDGAKGAQRGANLSSASLSSCCVGYQLLP